LLASSFNAYRKITMKILNLNDLHWISHSPSCFHYRSLRDAEIVAFCFFISVFIYFCLVYVWDLNLKWSWWLEMWWKFFELKIWTQKTTESWNTLNWPLQI
jgi:hypothetical protein